MGQRIAELCLAKDIGQVSFDRGGNIYHGRVKVRQLAIVLGSLELSGYALWQWKRLMSADWACKTQALADAAREVGLSF